jgi:hypothetical protein
MATSVYIQISREDGDANGIQSGILGSFAERPFQLQNGAAMEGCDHSLAKRIHGVEQR